MKYRQLGKSTIRISEIGFGSWAIGGPNDLFGLPVGWGSVDDTNSKAAINRALDLGVNFFDTADVYGRGHSEELLGRYLPSKTIVATKGGNARTDTSAYKDFSEAHLRHAVEDSLRRLNRETIDVYQLHNPPPPVWQGDEVFYLLQQLKSEGKIRLSGVSISRIEEGIHLVQKKKVDVIQVLFNVFNQEPAKQLFELAAKAGIGIIIRVPLASGLLTGKFKADHQFASDDNRRNYLSAERFKEVLQKVSQFQMIIQESGLTPTQAALAFILHHKEVSTAIAGAKTPEQVEANLSAIDVQLPPGMVEELQKAFSDYNFFLRYKVKI